MRKMILAILTFALCLSWAEVKVEKVLETTNTEKYNQWVVKNRTDVPCVRPILVDLEAYNIKSMEDTVNIEHKIYYYSESGKLIKEEIIRESDVYFYIPKTMDRIFIVKSRYKGGVDYRKVKNAKGETVLTLKVPMAYIGMDIYIESDIGEDIPREADAKIFDENGDEIGVIKHLAGVDGSQLCIACDERYAVFRGVIANGRPIICIDATGRIRWRKDFELSADRIFISADGTRIGVQYSNYVSIFNEDGNLINEFKLFEQGRAFKFALSENGDFLAVTNYSKKSKLAIYDVATGEPLWLNDSILTKNHDIVKSVHIDKNERVIVLCSSCNLYIFDKDGKLEYKKRLEVGAEFKGFSELHGQFLIITLGRASINDVYRRIQRRIIYEIVDKY
jgi:hypothetical protein